MRKSKKIKELICRRNEVIKRIQYRGIPDHLQNCSFADYKYWLLEPFIVVKYIPFIVASNKDEMAAQGIVYKIMDTKHPYQNKEVKENEEEGFEGENSPNTVTL